VGYATYDAVAPSMASFSSRGPFPVANGAVMKPDVTAPGGCAAGAALVATQNLVPRESRDHAAVARYLHVLKSTVSSLLLTPSSHTCMQELRSCLPTHRTKKMAQGSCTPT
jgi:hypothetical protein